MAAQHDTSPRDFLGVLFGSIGKDWHVGLSDFPPDRNWQLTFEVGKLDRLLESLFRPFGSQQRRTARLAASDMAAVREGAGPVRDFLDGQGLTGRTSECEESDPGTTVVLRGSQTDPPTPLFRGGAASDFPG
jgi:hypothetical protein